MRYSRWAVGAVFSFFSVFNLSAYQAGQTQNITLDQKVEVPGADLKPGSYVFSVEDTLSDRAIVRITSSDAGKYFLVLTAPNSRLHAETTGGFTFFTSSRAKQEVLRGWMCPGCGAELEFVYPKAQAAKITLTTTEPVLAYDPTYDKLPGNLSPDDMKVVTLWLLTPKPLTATDQQKGVEATKYVAPAAFSTQPAAPMQTASALAPGAPVETSSAVEPAERVQTAPAVQPVPVQRRLPRTASNNFSFIFWGTLLMFAAVISRISRIRRRPLNAKR